MLVLSHFTDEETGTQNGLKSYQRCKQWGTEKWYDPDDPALETVLNPYTLPFTCRLKRTWTPCIISTVYDTLIQYKLLFRLKDKQTNPQIPEIMQLVWNHKGNQRYYTSLKSFFIPSGQSQTLGQMHWTMHEGKTWGGGQETRSLLGRQALLGVPFIFSFSFINYIQMVILAF